MAQRLNKKLVVGLTVTAMAVITGAGILMVSTLPGRDPQPVVEQAEKLVAKARELEAETKALDARIGELTDETQKNELRKQRVDKQNQLQETYESASKHYAKAFARAVSAGDTEAGAAYLVKAGDLAFKTGDPRPAREYWSRVLLNNPKHEPAQERIVGLMLENAELYGQGWDVVRKEAEKLVAEDFAPTNAVGLNALGRALVETPSTTLEEMKKGGEYLKKASHLQNTNPKFADSLALYHLRVLEREIQEARVQSRLDQVTRLEATREQAVEAGLKEFETLMDALTKNPPEDPSVLTLAWRKRAQFHMVARSWAQAESEAQLKNRGSRADIEAARQRIASHSEKALECLETALKTSPKDVESLVLMGVYWRSTVSQATDAGAKEKENEANYLKAKEMFENAIKADPDSFDPYLELQQFHMRDAALAYNARDKDRLISSTNKATQVLEERIKRGAARTGLHQWRNILYMGQIRWQLYSIITIQIERLRGLAGSIETAKPEVAPLMTRLRQIRIDHVAESMQGEKDPRAMFMKARIDMLDGDPTAAIRSFEDVQDRLTKGELWVQTKMYLAQLYLQIDAPGEAAKALREVVDYLPAFDPALGLLAQALSVMPGREADAESMAKRALTVNPNNAEALNTLARIYEKQKNWKELERMQATMRSGQSDAQAELLEAALLLARGNDPDHLDPQLVDQAETKFRKVLELQPSNLQALRMLVSILAKEPAGAQEVPELLAKATADVEAKMNPASGTRPSEDDTKELQALKSNIAMLGILADPNTKQEERLARTEELIRQNPDPFMVEVDLFRLCLGIEERRAEAVAHLKKAHELKPDDPGVVEMLFRASLSPLTDKEGKEIVKPDWALAEKLVKRTVEVGIDRTEGHYYRGQLLCARTDLPDNFAQAEKAFRESLKIQPVHSNGHAWLGRALAGQNRLEEAQAAYQQAIAQNPRNGMAALELARVAALRGDEETKKKYVNVCKELKIQHPWIQDQIQRAEDEADPKAGIARREEIRKANPKDLNNLLALGGLYHSAGQIDNAKAIMAECYELQPQNLEFVQNYASFLRDLTPPDYAGAEAILRRTLESFGPDEKDLKATAQLLMAVHLEVMASRRVPDAPKLEEIDAVFAKAAEISSTPTILNDIASHYRRTNQPAKCEEWLRKCLALAEARQDSRIEVQARRSLLELMLARKDFKRVADIQKEIDAYRARFDDPYGLLVLSEFSSMLGRETAAIDYVTRFINATSEVEKALGFFRRGSMNYRRGDWDWAINDLREAKSLAPKGFQYEPRILLARCLQITGQNDQAIAELSSVLQDDPGALNAAEELYRVYMGAKRYDDAEAFIMPAYQRDRKSPRWIGLLAEIASARGDQKRALERAVETVQNAQYAPAVLDSLLSTYLTFRQFAEMLKYVETELPEAHRGSPRVQARLATAHLALGDLEKASQAYGRATSEAGQNAPQVLVSLLDMARHVEKAKAIQFIRDEAAKRPDNAVAALAAAQTLRGEGDEESYVGTLSQLVSKLPADDPNAAVLRLEALQGIAGSYHKRKQFEAARKAYEDFLEVAPEQSPLRAIAMNNLAYLLIEDLNEPAVALPYSEEAARMIAFQTNVLDTLGWNLILLGEYDRGIATVRQAIYAASAQDLVQFAAVHYHAAAGLHRRSQKTRQQGETAQAEQDMAEATLDCRRAHELLLRAHQTMLALSASPEQAQRAWDAGDGNATLAKVVALGQEIGLKLESKLPGASATARP